MRQEEISPEDEKSVWSKYGLRESPFVTIATRLLGIMPIEKVFSGRENDVARFVKILTSSNTTRTLVLGEFGVGKTTFVNYIKWKLCLKRETSEFVTTPIEIKIQPDWDSLKFLLSTLSSVLTASKIFRWEHTMHLPSLKDIEEYVSIGTQKSVQGSIGAIGGGYSEAKSIPPSISPEIYENLLTKLCLELREEGRQLIVSYDNMENIDLDKLSDLFRTIKDYIQIEGFHSIFIGPTRCLSALEKHQQVHSVFTQPIILSSLTTENVLDILKKRCESLKFKGGDYISPYDEETVKDLYKRLNNIRYTFKILEDANLFTEKDAPCKITINDIRAVQAKEKKETLATLTSQETKIITALMDSNSKINMGRLSKLTNVGNTNLVTPLKKLEEKGLVTIIQSDKDKRNKFVQLSENSYLRYFYSLEKINQHELE